jgi:hypothetical protein
VFGRVVMFMAGGWLAMSAFAWPESDVVCASTCVGGVLCILYALLGIFLVEARYLNTIHACVICLLSLSLDASSAARANNVMVAAVIFGASLLSSPGARAHGAWAWTIEGSNASRTGRPWRPGGAG